MYGAFKRHDWTHSEDAIVRQRWSTDSLSSIAAQIGVMRLAVTRRAHALGLPDRKAHAEPTPALTLVKSGDGYFNCAPERRADGCEPLPAGNALSWGAICENSVGAIL